MQNIPKLIHYVWLGGGEKSRFAQACITSWKVHFPDYEIVEWNEDNFDVGEAGEVCPFFRIVYEKRLFALIADYVRAKAILNHGGIYFDTDVQVVRPFPGMLLDCDFFISCPPAIHLDGAIMGGIPNHEVAKDICDFYETEIMHSTLWYMPTIVETIMQRRYDFQLDAIKSLEDVWVHADASVVVHPFLDTINKPTQMERIPENAYAVHWGGVKGQGHWESNPNMYYIVTKHLPRWSVRKLAYVLHYRLIRKSRFLQGLLHSFRA